VAKKEKINRSTHVPEKQMIFLFLFASSTFIVSSILVFGTLRSLIPKSISLTLTAGGVIAAGILIIIGGDSTNRSDDSISH